MTTGAGAVPRSPVAVLIVTHEAAGDIGDCLESVAALEPAPQEVVVVDCASTDGSVQEAERAAESRLHGTAFHCRPLSENRGFAGGMNVAIAASHAPWILSLNADARPSRDFLGRLLAPAEGSKRVAAVTGRLQRLDGEEPLLDACGMRLSPSWRHLDRGSGEVDHGQYRHRAAVFGATGAASLFRREALTDVAIDGQVFDEDFHSFREDAELCFRLQERGWQVLYEPAAEARHRRKNTPAQRRSMPASVNRNSLKNRYLLRAYHQTPRNLLLTLLPTTLREFGIVAWVVLWERESLAAYSWLWRNRRRIWRRRRHIQSRRTVPASALDFWFFHDERLP